MRKLGNPLLNTEKKYTERINMASTLCRFNRDKVTC